MNDNDRGLPGENGAIDCKALLQRLASAGYDGPVTAEPMPGCRTLARSGNSPRPSPTTLRRRYARSGRPPNGGRCTRSRGAQCDRAGSLDVGLELPMRAGEISSR